ncbi:hypothetical protein PIB30_040458 [Stylosanthes scabra]|uniref:Uncharacterized protein n=1 Tax=Stylosanthes scabra TaxID=79078 RepID=A0ABU6WI47_9FABA|nr:hypothetical protein [Stylosanthes scabra]
MNINCGKNFLFITNTWGIAPPQILFAYRLTQWRNPYRGAGTPGRCRNGELATCTHLLYGAASGRKFTMSCYLFHQILGANPTLIRHDFAKFLGTKLKLCGVATSCFMWEEMLSNT